MPVLRTLSRLSFKDHALFWEAVALTAVARLAILLVPFRRIAPWIGRQVSSEISEPDGDDCQKELLRRVRWAVETAGRRVPWKAMCLVQAMTARSMLRRRGRSGIVYFGLAKDDEADLQAHAWLRSGGLTVTGNNELWRYTTISAFGFGKQAVVAETSSN